MEDLAGAVFGMGFAVAAMLAVFRFKELECVWRDVALLIALRLGGALARYAIIVAYYDGAGDAFRYHSAGEFLRDRTFDGDFSLWTTEGWNGTRGLEWATAVLGVPALGSIIGEFFLFSAVGFVGLAMCVVALRRSTPGLPGRPLALVMFCWPSLVFWPSSIGKESMVLLALGMISIAIIGERRNWALLGLSMMLAFLIRPHVAGLLGVGLVMFDTLDKQLKRSAVLLRLTVSSLVAVWLVIQGAATIGVDATVLDSVTEEIQYRSNNTNRGGSSMGARNIDAVSLPLGLFNVLFRPLPFEARGPTMAIAAIEVFVFWAWMWKSRRAVGHTLRAWRRNRYLVFGMSFGLPYAALIGLTFVNMGILARQRVLMMPFLVGVLAVAVAQEARGRLRNTVATSRTRSKRADAAEPSTRSERLAWKNR